MADGDNWEDADSLCKCRPGETISSLRETVSIGMESAQAGGRSSIGDI